MAAANTLPGMCKELSKFSLCLLCKWGWIQKGEKSPYPYSLPTSPRQRIKLCNFGFQHSLPGPHFNGRVRVNEVFHWPSESHIIIGTYLQGTRTHSHTHILTHPHTHVHSHTLTHTYNTHAHTYTHTFMLLFPLGMSIQRLAWCLREGPLAQV